MLLDAGADANAIEDHGAPPLFLAIKGKQTEIVNLLLAADAHPNWSIPGKGMALLTCAASDGQRDIVKALINKSAEINTKDQFGLTPLMYAAIENHADTVELLIQEGAEIYVRTASGEKMIIPPSKIDGCVDIINLYFNCGADSASDYKSHQDAHSFIIAEWTCSSCGKRGNTDQSGHACLVRKKLSGEGQILELYQVSCSCGYTSIVWGDSTTWAPRHLKEEAEQLSEKGKFWFSSGQGALSPVMGYLMEQQGDIMKL